MKRVVLLGTAGESPFEKPPYNSKNRKYTLEESRQNHRCLTPIPVSGEEITMWSLWSWSHLLHSQKCCLGSRYTSALGWFVPTRRYCYLGPSVSLISHYCAIVELCKFKGFSRFSLLQEHGISPDFGILKYWVYVVSVDCKKHVQFATGKLPKIELCISKEKIVLLLSVALTCWKLSEGVDYFI